MKTKRGRKQDARRVNWREKHELDHRAKVWRCSKLAVILADMLGSGFRRHSWSSGHYVALAQLELRRANREAGRARGRKP